MKAVIQTFVALLSVSVGCCHVATQDEIERNKCYVNDVKEVLCWNSEKYPKKEIIAKLYQEKGALDSFGHIATEPKSNYKDEVSCGLCKQLVNMRIYPLTFTDHKGVSFPIVKMEHYHLSIRLNICAKDLNTKQSECHSLKESIANDWTPVCDQKHSVVKFLVYDQRNGTFTQKTVRYPSACICTIKKPEIGAIIAIDS